MSLTILNNISNLNAENSLSSTQMNLQKTLQQLSTGLKINSGSDDSAGLSIVNGMNANIAALTQSQQNVNNGVGLLQTADGALSQVTTLLNRAVTLATEAASSGLGASQSTALDTEYQSILSEINQIGQTTNFNGSNVFASTGSIEFKSTSTALATSTTLTAGDKTTITDSLTGGTFVFTATTGSTINDLNTAIQNAVSAGTLSAGVTASITGGQLDIKTTTANDSISVNTNDPAIGPITATASGAANVNTVFISDGVTAVGANTQIQTTINSLSATALALSGTTLSSAANAQTALTSIDAAVNTVSAQRGAIGASVNRLQAAANNMGSQVTNLQSAANNIQDADVSKTVSNMTQFNILESTGLAALQQSNQSQQSVLKLLQYSNH